MKPILRLILVMTGVMLFASKFCSAQNWPVETIKVNSWINATGDFDNDGDPDLVVINSDTIFWFENLQPGWKQHVIDPGFPNSDVASWVDAFDMDLDGDPDILQFIVTNPGTIVWNENRNNGMQWQKHTISTNVNEPSNMPRSYGDIDNDNDIDIVVPGFGDGKILWFENVSDNTLWKKHEIAVLGSYSVWTTLADIDGDSDLDIVAARYYAGSIVWYENQLPDSSWSMNRIAALPGTALGECVDLDNDGDLDLVSHSNATGAEVLSWFENPSWTPHAITSGLKYLWPGPCGDIDNDGDLDVTYASINSMQWSENLGEAKQWKNHIIHRMLLTRTIV